MKKPWLLIKIILTVSAAIVCPILSVILMIYFSLMGLWQITVGLGFILPLLLIPLIWIKKRKIFLISLASYLLCFIILIGAQTGIESYRDSITIDTAPSINVNEYLPFKEESKIIKFESKTLDFSEVQKKELPIIDGAAAVFPVYSAFVHAVYPESTQLYDGVFEYNNTVGGYERLATKDTDLFFGAAPSQEQIDSAQENDTAFKYTQIGSEAFVFFVHKDNPIESLTLDQIKGIYSGEITNWSEVGGKKEKIVAFQRNEGSGSQSMLIRMMGDTPIMEPDTQTRSDGMGGIIKEVADYKNKSSSIGFSFRYYVEGIVKNPDIKLIAIGGIAPNKENIKNGSYPIVAPLYAVTYEGNQNKNVDRLIHWVLSEEGQYIIEETGYVGLKSSTEE